MCGFIGAFARGAGALHEDDIKPALARMSRRGPDGEGLWHDAGVVLGHRRLSILDLETRASQPMLSACGRYAIAFNGEIYNFGDLRDSLQRSGTSFRTRSDTELLLELFAAEGEAMLPRLRGMFAFAIWDRVARRGFVARDAYGIKPLYLARFADGILVASQVKALLSTGKVSLAPDARGQAGFWMLGSVPEPRTWYRDVSCLPAGHFAWIEDGKCSTPCVFQDLGAVWRGAPAAGPPAAEVAAIVRQALKRSVSAHLVSDVPVGIFLSGGIDSGALAGLMRDAGVAKFKGVTIAFREFSGKTEDEAPVAAQIAKHYGIEHHIRVVERDEFRADLTGILESMDQPSMDGVNTWYAGKAAAELGLKVVLSGVGGDELFQGYSMFRKLPRLVSAWRSLSSVPGALLVARAAAGLKARQSGNRRWKQAPDWARSISGAWWLSRSLFVAEELPALMGRELAAEGLQDFDPRSWVEEMSGPLAGDLRLALSQIESSTYLRNQLLRDSDWATMHHGVELRAPLVDAWLLKDLQPILAQFRSFPGKVLLSEAPELPLPQENVHRVKTGFGIPIGRWLDEKGAGDSPGEVSRNWARRVVEVHERKDTQ